MIKRTYSSNAKSRYTISRGRTINVLLYLLLLPWKLSFKAPTYPDLVSPADLMRLQPKGTWLQGTEQRLHSYSAVKGRLSSKELLWEAQNTLWASKARCAKGKVWHKRQADRYWNAYHMASSSQNNASKVRFHLAERQEEKESRNMQDCTSNTFCYNS